jgi:uncharacterized C2H2 Zn-finger protein
MSEEYPFKCPRCSWVYNSKIALEEHLKDHERWDKNIKVVSKFIVRCKDYVDGIDFLLNKYESYPEPVDDFRKYYNDDGMIVVIMTPIGDLWTFDIKIDDEEYIVELIGSSELLREKWGY